MLAEHYLLLKKSTAFDSWDCEQLDYCSDKAGFEAIRWLHRKLDDDANGNVDIAESDEFLRDELKYENSHERHKAFHGNDKQISVDELWSAWKVSEVHNWTVEQTVEWLSTNVELPQYADLFINHGINGTFLPRLASSFAIGYGIKDPIHRQKIALKAMDVVLFGPPKHHNFVKDVLLALSLIIAAGGCWFAYVQHTRSQSHLKKMLKDMESLQRAEDQLTQLQRELDKAQQEQIRVVSEKKTLEEKLKATEVERHFVEKANGFAKEKSLPNISDFNRIYELEAELNEIKQQLNRAETALKSKSWVPPQELQNWLKITFKIESQNIEIKRRTAILQMESAKRACEKLNRTRSSFLGSFKVAHGSTIDEVDQQLIEAKASLSKVISEIQERTVRWREIQQLCGFSILDSSITPSTVAATNSSSTNITRNNSECSLDSESSFQSSLLSETNSLGKNEKRNSRKSVLSFRLSSSKNHKNFTSCTSDK